MKRNWWYLLIAACFIANTISLYMGGTHPVYPDTNVWIGHALVTAALCVAFVIHPTRLLAQATTAAVLIASASRAIGAIGWNPNLASQFGGGSIWSLIFIFALQTHRLQRRV